MDDRAIEDAVEILAALRAGEEPVADLGARGPASIEDAHRIQDALIRRLGEPVAGWKVAGLREAEVMRGGVLASRLLPSGASIRPRDAPLLGIELEIAFRIDRDLPPESVSWDRTTLAASVTALPVIEIVATRFIDYQTAPIHHRLADMMSNAFLIVGAPRADWMDFDFSTIGTRLRIGDDEAIVGSGGHSAGDPLAPALAFIRSGSVAPLRAGQIVTTGTYTGLRYARPGMRVEGEFTGFGAVGLTIAAL